MTRFISKNFKIVYYFFFIEISNQDYYKFVDCMPEKREQDGEYVEQTCKDRGCVWDESSNPKERSKLFYFNSGTRSSTCLYSHHYE